MILILKCKCTQTRSSKTVPPNWRLEEVFTEEDQKEEETHAQDLRIKRLKATCPICLRIEQCEKENETNNRI